MKMRERASRPAEAETYMMIDIWAFSGWGNLLLGGGGQHEGMQLSRLDILTHD